jgi:tetratricopeptide (TPR) repeat protein
MKYSFILPIAASAALYAAPTHSLSAPEVAKIAKQSTIRIESPNSPGSGVIIRKEGNTYIALTAAHVVRNRSNNYRALTADGATNSITNVRTFPGQVDLALVSFTSTKNYGVAKLAANAGSVAEGETVYVSGFPVTGTITEAVFNFTEGKVSANSSRPMNDGYSLVYTNNTLPGHSGGPVWNEAGELIAIHGKGDIDTKQQKSEINPNIRVKTGFNLGISINTFTQLASQVGLSGFGGNSPVAVAPAPKPVDDLIVAGLAKLQSRNFNGALQDFNQAIRLDSRRANAYQYRAQAKAALVEDKILTESAYVSNLYGQMLNDFDQDAELLIYKQFTTEYRSALTDYQQSLQLDGSSSAALQGAAKIHAYLGEFPQAINLLNRALQMKPDAETYGLRAEAKLKQGDTKGAISDISRAIQLDGRNHLLYNVRASIYTKQQQHRQAIQDYDRALSLVPKTEQISILGYYVSRASAKSNAKDYRGAIADVTAIINNNDAPALKPTLHLMRGVYYFGLENYAPALEDLNAAARLDAKNAFIYFFRASILFKQEKYDASLNDINKALQVAPDFAEANLVAGAIHIAKQNWPASLSYLEKAVKLAEGNPSKKYLQPDAYELRGYSYVLNSRKAEGLRDLNRAAELYRAANNMAKYRELKTRIAQVQQL